MRACFLGQNVCALGYGVAMVQTPPADDKPHPEAPTEPAVPKPPVPNRMFADLKRQPHYS